MGTRSFIAVESDKDILGCYCHWDGYLEHNGRMLAEHYDGPGLAIELVSPGDMSCLRERVGEPCDFDSPPADQCVYYGRDRGESDVAARTFPGTVALLDAADECGAEYVYLYSFEGEWLYCERGPQYFGGSDGSPFSGWKPLKPALAAIAD